MNKEQKREFTGVWIPKKIIEDKRLKPVDKILYAEIACFDVCYKKSSELMERCGIKKFAFNESCKRLVAYGYIKESRKFGKIHRNSTLKFKTPDDEQSGNQTDEQSGNQAVLLDNTLENTNIADVKSATKTPPEEKFNQKEYIDGMKKKKQAHIRFIGWYFEKRKSNFPTKESIQIETKRWLKDASFIVKYPQIKVSKAYELVRQKYPDEWNMSTIRKVIPEA